MNESIITVHMSMYVVSLVAHAYLYEATSDLRDLVGFAREDGETEECVLSCILLALHVFVLLSGWHVNRNRILFIETNTLLSCF